MNATQIQLSEDQSAALDAIAEWARDDSRQEFVLGGLAGTGKTTLVRRIFDLHNAKDSGLPRVTAILALSGKAVSVLRKKGLHAQTIHSAVFEFAGLDKNGDPTFDALSGKVFCAGAMVIVDEASMVDTEAAEEIRRHASKILWVGDHGQLPPVGNNPRIMQNCDIRLERIHRQAAESPILRLAHHVREGHSFAYCGDDGDVSYGARVSPETIATMAGDFDVVLVGKNETRRRVNAAARALAGLEDVLEVDESIVCLRNDHRIGICNGDIYRVVRIGEPLGWCNAVEVDIADDEREYAVSLFLPSLGREKPDPKDPKQGVQFFDYASAITTHKAQGSEWDSVLLVDEGYCFREDAPRWRYTAVTRAKERLHVVR